MKHKSLIALFVLVISLTFASVASAGILGGILGGLLNSTAKTPKKASLEQLEAFHKKYLENVAEKLKKTGDINGAFNDVLTEQRNFGYNVRVMTNTAELKDAEFSGGDLPVIVKAVVDTKAQEFTITYLDQQDGSIVGDKITKHYDLPGNKATEFRVQDTSEQANEDILILSNTYDKLGFCQCIIKNTSGKRITSLHVTWVVRTADGMRLSNLYGLVLNIKPDERVQINAAGSAGDLPKGAVVAIESIDYTIVKDKYGIEILEDKSLKF